MTHGSLPVHCTRNVLDAIIGYRYFPRIFLVKNWSSIFFKNNTWSEKNSAKKIHAQSQQKTYWNNMWSVFKVSKQEKHQNDVADTVRMSLLLTLNTFHTFP